MENEESILDKEISELQEELFRLKIDEKNLHIALRILAEREAVENEFRRNR